MSGGFLDSLGSMIDQQFALSDNKQNTLDVVENGNVIPYGALGDFTKRFDRTAERRYLEEGYTRHSRKPKLFQILMQEPDVTLVVKKKEFSSLKMNNKPQYQDKEDKLFMKAASVLFANKCAQIAAYERLCKIDRIARASNNLDVGLLPILLNTYDVASVIPGLNSIFSDKFKGAMEKVRKVIAYNKTALTTTWTTDPNRLFKSTYGTGTGVIEITNLTNVNTNVGTRWASGSCSFSIEDPYRMMVITTQDIEQAISEVANPLRRSSFINDTKQITRDMIDKNKRMLNLKRRSRGANPINFIINPDTYLGKRIRVLIDGIGHEIHLDSSPNFEFDDISDVGDLVSGNLKTTFDAANDFGSEELGNQGLKEDEKTLIRSIINSLTTLISFDINSQSKVKRGNISTNRLRRKLMLHYGKKHIIQPMDVVHVYMQSKTKVDNKLIGGLQSTFTGFGFMQNLSQQLNDMKQGFNTLFGGLTGAEDIEKTVFVGPDFPSYLWSVLRNHFVEDKAGTHVFAGLVDDASGSFSGGKYTISVNCKDNAHYFNLSKYNKSPSIENFQGPLMDPITPFELNLDKISGQQKEIPKLLDENKKFFLEALPKYSSGGNAGRVVTEQNHEHQDSDAAYNNGTVQNVFYPPEGTVYRWKEGIATLTLARDTYGNGFNTSIPTQNFPRVTTEEAFAGQDIMNVLSLLITGEAYNFATFFKTILQFESFKDSFLTDPSYYRNLQNELRKNNELWGNFQPFKSLIMPDEALVKIMDGTLSAMTKNTKLDDLLARRAETFDKLAYVSQGIPDDSVVNRNSFTSSAPLQRKLEELDAEIQQAEIDLMQSFESGSQYLHGQIGDDISFDVDRYLSTAKQRKEALHNPDNRKQLRRKINFLTRRMFYNVKANEDKNLFIVDDSYDKDLEIQAFSKAIGKELSLFQNEYSFVGDQIESIAEKLNLEVFADTQGHIRVRPEQYNRIPNSVFLQMLRNKELTGVQIFPQFLQDLYSNQLQSYIKSIEVVEDQIRLLAAGLSIDSDDRIVTELINDDVGFGLDNAPGFAFISDESTGRISSLELQSLAHPDMKAVNELNNIDRKLNELNNIDRKLEDQATKVQFAFSAKARKQLIVDRFDREQTNPIPAFREDNPALTTRINDLTNRLSRRTGTAPNSIKKIFKGEAVNNASALEVFRVSKEIASLVSERQRMIKVAASAVRAVKDAVHEQVESEKIGSSAISRLAFPNLYGQKGVPEVLEHMIEDESYDDYGPGSGSRYIIQNHHIIRFTYKENAPEFNFLQVNGLFGGIEGFFREGEGPRDLDLGQGGNTQTTAYAVDYDMWRMYGFRAGNALTVPFLSDPETQLAPYAVAMINRARGKMLTASLEIVGNEYMQPGEVVYVEPLDLLFYVKNVQHNFTIGSSFTTSLTLEYGHNPGEYIPTAFDIAGKVLYNNRDNHNHVVIRNDSSFNEVNLGALAFPTPALSLLGSGSEINSDQYGKMNIETIRNIQFGLLGVLSANNNLTTKPVIEVRYYYYSNGVPKNGVGSSQKMSPDPVLAQHAQLVQDLFTGGASRADIATFFGKDPPPSFAKTDIVPMAVDLSAADQYRTPSAKAWELARGLTSEGLISETFGGGSVSSKLVSGVIDIWVNYGSVTG